MKAWKLTGVREYKHFSSDESSKDNETFIELPAIDPSNSKFIQVKMVKANLSVTDIDSYNATCGAPLSPITPSRSALAMVSESFSSDYEIGRRVFLSPYHSDIKADPQVSSCHVDGYMSDYAIVDTDNAYPIPEGMPDNEVLFVEDVAIAMSALSKLHLSKGNYIALHGASHHNCILAQLAIYYQIIPIIIDNDEDRLNIAQNLGVYYTVNINHDDPYRKTIEITSGKMIDALVIDADFSPSIDDLSLIKRGGTICIYGYKRCKLDLDTKLDTLLTNALTIIGIDNGQNDIRSAINLIANKVLKFNDLIETETPFNNLVQIMKSISPKENPLKHIITFI